MATLKISDLSVGDWVKASGVAKRVHSIEYQNGVYFVNFSDPDTNSEDYMHAPSIKPIPLTPEILEANGFVDNGVGQHYLKCGNGITARVGRNPLSHDGCWLVATDKQVDETISTTCVLFDAIFNEEMSGKIYKILRNFEPYIPDTTYQEDVCSFWAAFKREMENIKII